MSPKLIWWPSNNIIITRSKVNIGWENFPKGNRSTTRHALRHHRMLLPMGNRSCSKALPPKKKCCQRFSSVHPLILATNPMGMGWANVAFFPSRKTKETISLTTHRFDRKLHDIFSYSTKQSGILDEFPNMTKTIISIPLIFDDYWSLLPNGGSSSLTVNFNTIRLDWRAISQF